MTTYLFFKLYYHLHNYKGCNQLTEDIYNRNTLKRMYTRLLDNIFDSI